MSQGKAELAWTIFKNAVKNLQTFLTPPVKLFKNAFDFIGSLSEILKNAPSAFTKFVMFIGNVAHNSNVKLVLGFITPILATIDLICDIYKLNSLRDEARKKIALRLLQVLEKNPNFLNERRPNIAGGLLAELNDFTEKLKQEGLFTGKSSFGDFQTAVHKYLEDSDDKHIKAEFDAVAKLMEQFNKNEVEDIFNASNLIFKDGQQDRKNFENGYDKQFARTRKALIVVVFAWLATIGVIIKYALGLAGFATTSIPLVAVSLSFAYLSVITLIIFTGMELYVLGKDFYHMYKGVGEKGQKFQNDVLAKVHQQVGRKEIKWEQLGLKDILLPAAKAFVTEGFALDMFTIILTSGVILVTILVLVSVVFPVAPLISVPVAGMITAALFITIVAVKIVDKVVRALVNKYYEPKKNNETSPHIDPIVDVDTSTYIPKEEESMKEEELTEGKKEEEKEEEAPRLDDTH